MAPITIFITTEEQVSINVLVLNLLIIGGGILNGNTMRHFIFYIITLLFMGCSMLKPVSSIEEYNFIIYPQIVEKDSSYILKYHLSDTMRNGSPILFTIVNSKIKNEKLYFYFEGVTSFIVTGKLIEIPLDKDGEAKYAEEDAVYWLNSDQSEVKLKVIKG